MVTFVVALTPVVGTENVPVVLPAGIVMLAGTEATAALLLDSVTTTPPAGAAENRVTVACEGEPPSTLFGFSASEESKGLTLSTAFCELLL